MIARQGLAYRLALPPGAQVDHVAVDDAVAAARAAQLAGDTEAFARALARVLDLADGPFLPEDGPDDWVLPKRARYRACVTSAALSLAELHAAGGRPAEAAEACRRGLAADACADGLWRVLIDTTEAAGDLAAAARARREYASVLAELGLPGPLPEDERQVRSRS
jgi:DNA-binding SARP family transcriptional activator